MENQRECVAALLHAGTATFWPPGIKIMQSSLSPHTTGALGFVVEGGEFQLSTALTLTVFASSLRGCA
jgi:hypothetical protein